MATVTTTERINLYHLTLAILVSSVATYGTCALWRGYTETIRTSSINLIRITLILLCKYMYSLRRDEVMVFAAILVVVNGYE